MKTNPTTINRPLATVLLLTLFVGLSSCESAEPVNLKSAYRPIKPAVIPDTLVADPSDPTPVKTVTTRRRVIR